MSAELNCFSGEERLLFWENFENYHDPIWDDAHIFWVDYVNHVLDGIGIYFAPPGVIKFNTEEDMINFMLKWS